MSEALKVTFEGSMSSFDVKKEDVEGRVIGYVFK